MMMNDYELEEESKMITRDIYKISELSNEIGIPVELISKLLTQSADQLIVPNSDLSNAMTEFQMALNNNPAIKKFYQNIIAEEIEKNPTIQKVQEKLDKILVLLTNERKISKSSISSKSFESALSLNYDEDDDENADDEEEDDIEYDLSGW